MANRFIIEVRTKGFGSAEHELDKLRNQTDKFGKSGKKMRLKSKGIQKLGGYGYGDQIIGIHVETPTKLTSEQKGIFEDLEKLNNKSSHPMAKGFFEKVKNLFQ